eukprot:TRINITY_DN4226_c0_g1_i2.p1 TRINITY_DN4226_c0_g1~~TRINITY_DN4226_c0_g1_i2.p1  ORF type:complete len:204 (+),score=33.62 TRINITY_DN4226_c0_g1_i2:87-698(+)
MCIRDRVHEAQAVQAPSVVEHLETEEEHTGAQQPREGEVANPEGPTAVAELQAEEAPTDKSEAQTEAPAAPVEALTESHTGSFTEAPPQEPAEAPLQKPAEAPAEAPEGSSDDELSMDELLQAVDKVAADDSLASVTSPHSPNVRYPKKRVIRTTTSTTVGLEFDEGTSPEGLSLEELGVTSPHSLNRRFPRRRAVRSPSIRR